MATAATKRPHVVIVGGGFAGLRAARELGKAPVDITLIDRANHHLFQPLLYQVATAGMTAEEIAVPIRSVLRKNENTRVLLGEVTHVDVDAREAHLADGSALAYDYLIVAAGAQTNYFGHDEWKEYSVGLKTVEDAFELRRRVLLAFEAAERETDPQRRRELLTFVVIGGGPTGVEMAGALSELSRDVLARDFRVIHPSSIRVVLVEMMDRLLAPFHPSLSERAVRDLEQLGVEVRIKSPVIDIRTDGVQLQDEFIPAVVTCWAAGVEPQPLSRKLGVATNKRGLVVVDQDCSVPGHPEVFAVGDIASFIPKGSDKPLPGLAPVAMQQARNVADNIKRTLAGKERKPFQYVDKGIMSTIGTSRAVAQTKGLRITGFVAWVAWIVVHVYYLIGFGNRVRVMFDWFWSYATKRRGARVITNVHPAGYLQISQERSDNVINDLDERPAAQMSAPTNEVAYH